MEYFPGQSQNGCRRKTSDGAMAMAGPQGVSSMPLTISSKSPRVEMWVWPCAARRCDQAPLRLEDPRWLALHIHFERRAHTRSRTSSRRTMLPNHHPRLDPTVRCAPEHGISPHRGQVVQLQPWHAKLGPVHALVKVQQVGLKRGRGSGRIDDEAASAISSPAITTSKARRYPRGARRLVHLGRSDVQRRRYGEKVFLLSPDHEHPAERDGFPSRRSARVASRVLQRLVGPEQLAWQDETRRRCSGQLAESGLVDQRNAIQQIEW